MNVGYSEMKPLFESGWVLTPSLRVNISWSPTAWVVARLSNIMPDRALTENSCRVARHLETPRISHFPGQSGVYGFETHSCKRTLPASTRRIGPRKLRVTYRFVETYIV
jgi:hypothetical protein